MGHNTKDPNWSIDRDVEIIVPKKDVCIAEIKLFDIIPAFMVKNITNAKNAEELTIDDNDEKSIDLIFADPPYNLSGNGLKWQGNKTGGDWYMVNEAWDKMFFDSYVWNNFIPKDHKYVKIKGLIIMI